MYIESVGQTEKIYRKATLSIGENKGAPRIWLEGKWLQQSGFECGNTIRVDVHTNKITVVPDPDGKRKISGKKKGTVPVIDLNTYSISEAFNNADMVQVTAGDHCITITPAYTAVLMSNRKLVKTEASMFSGAGFLTLAAKLCGYTPKLAIEIDPVYASLYSANHPEAQMYNMCASHVPHADLINAQPIGIFTAGIPCEPFSKIRRLDRGGQEKRDTSLVPEAHELGDMTFWALRNIEALNPHTVVLEEVPGFLNSGAGEILLHVLRRLYRYAEARILDPTNYGSLTGRKRAVVIAQDLPIKWPEEHKADLHLGDIFEDINHEWFDRNTKAWLFNHWEKQTAKGNGFASQIYNAQSDHIGTIKKRYFAQQGDNPVIAHPTQEDVYRWLTINEVKRLHGIPDDYYVGEAKTTAGEVIGQGVVVDMFKQVIESVTQ